MLVMCRHAGSGRRPLQKKLFFFSLCSERGEGGNAEDLSLQLGRTCVHPSTVIARFHRLDEDTLFDSNVTLTSGFQYAAYHWTGDESIVRRSKVRGFDNIYLADAMSVTGTTSVWTSFFNAHVAGALAALRSMNEDQRPCLTFQSYYKMHAATSLTTTAQQVALKYKQFNCCR